MRKKLLLLCALLISVITLSGAVNVISFKTSKKIGEKISLNMEYLGAAPTLSGATGTPKDGEEVTYTLTSQTVTITGYVTYFDCSKNQLTTLDVSQNTALQQLYCGKNQLTTLDVSKNTYLTQLSCSLNPLTALDVSKNTALINLGCSYNQLTALDVSKNTRLVYLECCNNQLKALDVSKNTALIWLYCFNNQLTALDVSKNTALTKLWCFGNQIKGEEMTRLVNSLPDYTGKYAGGTFTVVQEPDLEGNICFKSDVAIAKGKNWDTQKYKSDTKKFVPYKGADATYVITFTTAKAVGEDISLKMTYTGDTPTLSGATGTPESGKMISYTLTSQTVTIRGDVDVTELYCNGNQLTTLDVSQNTALTNLSCSSNQLTALDVSQNTALTDLDCHYNQLTALDISQNTALTKLHCSNNQLKALDVSKNTALTELDCSDNQLTALDVSQNTALTKLHCSNNQLKALDVSKNTKLICLTCWSNQLTALDVSKNTALTELNCTDNQLTTLDVSQNTALTVLGCYINQLTALDVSKNTALTLLFCSNNQLTALDVSKNTALTLLFCSNNQLKALDVSQNTSLIWVSCFGNQIKGVEMTRLVNSLPDRTVKSAGTFAVVQEPDLEGNICFKSDVAIAKGKNWNTQKYKSDTKEFVAYEGAQPLKVTLTKEGEGTLTATGATDLNAVPEGTELTIEATPAAGYELTALTANGTDILATKKFVVTAATEVKATFAKKTYAVTLTKEGEGTITATGATDLNAVPFGTELTIEATPAAGYELTALSANGADILATKKVVVTGATEVKATFTKKTYAVTLTKEGEGTITATGADDLNAVPEGTELTIVATPATGYELKALTANGADILATKKFVVTAATEVKATFAKKTATDVVNGSSVRLYPNPASTYVSVKAAKADALVRLYDANGLLRYEARTDADGTLQIDLSAYAEGIYLLLVDSNAQRLLIQR